MRFNPRVREGRDYLAKVLLLGLMFQSTRPRGTRRAELFLKQVYDGFNPRVREGRDYSSFPFTLNATGFNPRVREGRDLTELKGYIGTAYTFQSTRPRGTRPGALPSPLRFPPVSIHASARDATVEYLGDKTPPGVSIHASARDAT